MSLFGELDRGCCNANLRGDQKSNTPGMTYENRILRVLGTIKRFFKALVISCASLIIGTADIDATTAVIIRRRVE